MKKKVSVGFAYLVVISLGLYPQAVPQEPTVESFICELQKSLQEKDIAAYLDNFSPELRGKEEEVIRSCWDDFGADSAILHKASREIPSDGGITLYLRALFQNPHSAFIETWQLRLQKEDGRWLVKNKEVTGTIGDLYRISMPAERVERFDSVEVEHVDITLSFQNALVFFDNLPQAETALLVIGDGQMRFSPSHPVERHQLELVYSNPSLERKLEYAFLRFSNDFFPKNIRMKKSGKKSDEPISQAEMNKAYSLFVKHYPRSFTIQNSLNGELLSFIPKGEEAVFEVRSENNDEYTYVYSPFAEEEVNFFDLAKDMIISLYSPQEEGEDKESRRMFVTFSQKFDVLNYQIELDFNPSQSFLSAKARVDILSQVEKLDGLKLKLSSELDILRIYDEEMRELFFTRDGLRQTTYIYFLDPLSKGEKHSLEIFYRGNLEPPPQIADVISAGQYNETVAFVPQSYENFLYSQSSYWYPAPPDDDYFTARLSIIVPPAYTCISNGEFIRRERLNGTNVLDIEKAGHYIYNYETRNPVKYLTFIVGKYMKTEEEDNPLPITVYATSDVRIIRRSMLEDTQDVIQFYENAFGPFPFEKLNVIQRLWPLAGGHSPASFVVLNVPPRTGETGASGYYNVNSPVDLSRWKEYFLAHEIAHQWWGQGVTWTTYHDQWLSEGLAQFSSALYLRQKYGRGVYRDILEKFSKWTRKKSHWGPITLGSRISYVDFEGYQAVVYNKTALVLNMLLEWLGEDVFFEGLGRFFETYKYNTASTGNFKKVMETTSGEDLDDFFDGWFYSYSLPECEVSHSFLEKQDGYQLKFEVVQTGSGGKFVFPLWVEWKEDGQKVTEKLDVIQDRQEFHFDLKTRPKSIKVDPEKIFPGKCRHTR